MSRRKGGNCHSCGQLITDGISLLMYVVNILTDELLNVFQYHSSLSAHKLQNVREKALGTGRHCYNNSLLRKGVGFSKYKSNVNIGTVDGDTLEHLTFLYYTFPNRTRAANDSMNEIAASCTNMNHGAQPVKNTTFLQQLSIERLSRCIEFAEEFYGRGKVIPELRKSTRSDYYNFSVPGISNDFPIALTRVNAEHLADFGIDYLRVMLQLTQIPQLNWGMTHASGFIKVLLGKSHSLDTIRSIVVPFLQCGVLSKKSGINQLHSDVDAIFRLMSDLSSIKQLKCSTFSASQFLQSLQNRYHSLQVVTTLLPLLKAGTLANSNGMPQFYNDIDDIIKNISSHKAARRL